MLRAIPWILVWFTAAVLACEVIELGYVKGYGVGMAAAFAVEFEGAQLFVAESWITHSVTFLVEVS